MKLRTGVDLIEIERIEQALARHGEKFLQRAFTPSELAICTKNRTQTGADEHGEKNKKSASIRFHPHPKNENTVNSYSIESLAVRFAAKEAAAKALGTGIGAVGFQEIEILRDENRAPVLYLRGAAQALADKLKLETWSISLSHTKNHAVALVVAIGK